MYGMLGKWKPRLDVHIIAEMVCFDVANID
jgi:hypothetical protein